MAPSAAKMPYFGAIVMLLWVAALIDVLRTLLERPIPAVMGVLNVTPDSFSDGGEFIAPDQALSRARAMGWARVMLVGDAPYYSRFGFARLEGVEMPPPTNPDRVLGLELVSGAWVGVRGDVLREDSPDVRAALAEIEASVDLRQACIEVEAPNQH